MDAFFASPETQICRAFRNACCVAGSAILRTVNLEDQVRDFAEAVASGLLSAPRHLDCRFLYDAEGSALFDRITQQPEYYLTRTETSILAANASRIRDLTAPVTLVELGSGSPLKIGILLDSWLQCAPSACYVPIDVSRSALSGASHAIRSARPQVRVVGVNCEYREALPLLPQLSPALVLFLGSSIGNFTRAEMFCFFATLAASMDHGHFLLLGVDLVKEKRVIESAYNDAAGVTATFTRNVFARMNRELGCSIDTDAIEHVARYNPEKEQVEIFAHFTRRQVLTLAPLHRQLVVPQGELVQIEISRKFRVERFLPYLRQFGLVSEQVFTDPQQWFALFLLRREPPYLSVSHRRS